MADRCKDHSLAGDMKPKVIASHTTNKQDDNISILPNIVVNPLTGVVTNKIRIPGKLYSQIVAYEQDVVQIFAPK